MLKPKKSLGQNFLRDVTVLDKIIQAANLKSSDNIIEIGPGEGVLTEELIKLAGKVIAIEKDNNLALQLNSRLRGNDKILVVTGDILEINLPELIEKNNFQNYKVVANIPYYITSPIIRLFLETKYPPQELILMVQKEVAERICATAGQMSILAVSVQYYAVAKIIMSVDKKSFWPVPEVDSAVIRIVPTRKNISQEESRLFFRLVKAGFSAKRKTLINNLSTSLQLDKENIAEKIARVGLAPAVRAQELSLANWEKLKDLLLPELL